MTTLSIRRTYDHRTREMIWETGHPDLFPELKIPRSTIRSRLHRGITDVVTCDPLSAEKTELLAELQELRHRVAVLGAIVGLLVVMLRVSERRMDRERLPEGNEKGALLRAIERASRAVLLSAALRIARRLLSATTAGAAPRFGVSLTTASAVHRGGGRSPPALARRAPPLRRAGPGRRRTIARHGAANAPAQTVR